MNEFNPSEVKRHLADSLVDKGFSKEEAKESAAKAIGTMGATKTKLGLCPLGKISAIACMFCSYGHMTECHFPLDCKEANCSHYQQAELEEKGDYGRQS